MYRETNSAYEGSSTLKSLIPLFLVVVLGSTLLAQGSGEHRKFPTPQIPFAPKHYVCYRTASPVRVDGKLDDESWSKAPWTDYFVDIEGTVRSAPLRKTRVKMLWDDRYLYVSAELQEPNLWATLTQRDAVIYRDNDFEVFIDPNGATQPYYETEINALGTIWDLLLLKPYRDAEKVAIHTWDIKGLKVAVSLQGTINSPSDIDTGWTVEIAFPWDVLAEGAFSGAPPKNGMQWRVNFSRVEWRTKVVHGAYVKETDLRTGQELPENNWVWSPQGLIDMHYPEMWGFLQFSNRVSGEGSDDFIWNPLENVKWNLRLVYYAERQYFNDHGCFSDDLSKLEVKFVPSNRSDVQIYATPNLFEAIIPNGDGKTQVHIDHEGRTWMTHAN
jgi:hypothetical protein